MVVEQSHPPGAMEHVPVVPDTTSTVWPSTCPAVQEAVSPANAKNNRSNGTQEGAQDFLVDGNGHAQSSQSARKSYAHQRRRILLQNPHLARSQTSFAVRLQGPFHREALQSALEMMMKRHEILRTSFSVHDGGLIELGHAYAFKFEPLHVIDGLDNDEAVLRRMEEDVDTEFDLENEPAWRVFLYRLGEEKHLLFVVMHCIISDSRTPKILLQELATQYSTSTWEQTLLPGQTVLIQHRSTVNRESSNGGDVADQQRQLRLLVDQFQNSRPVEFPCDKPRPAASSTRLEQEGLEIGSVLYAELQTFCSQNRHEMSVALVAAFRVAHYRLTGSDDATLAVVDERDEETACQHPPMGHAANMHLVPGVAVEGKSFKELLSDVQTAMQAAKQSQDAVPWELLAYELQKTRGTWHSPRQFDVQVALFLHSNMMPISEDSFRGVQAQIIGCPLRSRHDIEVHVHLRDASLVVEAVFSTDVYSSATIRAILSTLETTLRQGLNQPDTTVASLPLLTDDARQRLAELNLLGGQEDDYPRDCSVVDMFEQQVANRPDAVAVKDSSGQLTYRQLDRQSDVVSRWLRRRLLPPETVVAVLALRSCETIVALLGILKAHVAYLPLDVNQPHGRLEKMLSSFHGRRLVLCGQKTRRPELKEHLAEFVAIGDVMQEQDPAQDPSIATERGTLGRPLPTSLAHVLFTSGSTGEPKGVMIEHRSIVRLAKCRITVQHMTSTDITAHLSNVAFDAATWEIYTALLNGGTLVCIEAMAVLQPRLLGEILTRERIQRAFFTTALFKEYTHHHPGLFEALRDVYVGGEKVHPLDFIAARKLLPRGKLFHCYGPTENTSLSTIFVDSEREPCLGGVPLGPAVNNSGAHVMDPDLRLVPLGVMGELVLTGDGLARGYTDPRRDIGRFVTIELGGKEIRAYRTGDHVRRRPLDGALEFIGRLDGQIKLRGHRIELGEIEQALRGCGSVENAVAVVSQQPSSRGQCELVGFVTLDETAAEPPDDDKQHQDAADDGQDDHVGGWGDLFNAEKYLVLADTEKVRPGRDFTAWTSMYDGKNIDVAEMNEWLDDTIAAIRDGGQPRAVLEIGSGTGMILFNIVEGLTSYVGLDPAQRAVDFVRTMARSMPALADKTSVHLGAATDVGKVGELNSPNLVIVNSVVQYFPSLDYLSSVVEDLLQLDSTEQLFFGDIRSFALYREFQVAKILHRAEGRVSTARLLEEMARIERAEEELLVDPAFFTALVDRFPDRVAHVEILPKKMRATNELSCYRYSAVVHVKRDGRHHVETRDVPEELWTDFVAEKLDRDAVADMLTSRPADAPALVAISNIPNAKGLRERCVVDALDGGDTVSVPRDDWHAYAAGKTQSCPALSTTDLLGLAETSGFRVEMSWARQHSRRGGLDAVFHRLQAAAAEGPGRVKFRFPTEILGEPPCRMLATQPLRLRLTRRIERRVLEELKSQLPSYMLPRLIRVVDKMPINRNGKLDRQALARGIKKTDLNGAQTNQEPPRNDVERVLCEAFARVLGITLGIHDDFFQHGGHSLNATRASSGINTRLGANITVKDIFDCPTVAALAQRIGASGGSGRHVPIPRRKSVQGEHAEQSFAQRRLWFLEQLHPGSTWYLLPFAVRLRGPLDYDALTAALCALEERHETLRTTFGERNGVAVQIVQPFRPSRLDVTDLDTAATNGAEEVVSWERGVAEEQTKPFDLEREKPWRVKLYRLGEHHHVLSIVMHHIASDGWSVDVLRKELAGLYSAARQAGPPPRPLAVKPLPVRYQDYAAWQKGPDQAEEHQRQLDYWVEHLDGSRPAELWCDGRRPAALSGRAAAREFEIAGSLYDKLMDFCRARRHVTPFIVLLAAFRAAHYRLTGATDATIGTPIANRNRQELEEMIGFFVNIQCMRIRIEEEESFQDLVQQVRSVATRAFANQDVPFETIVSRLQTDRDASRNPLVQIVFALHPQLDLGRFQLQGVVSEPLSSSVTSRFDLECHLFQEKQSLRGRVVFSTDLYRPQTIENLTRTFCDLVERGMAEPETRIHALPLLTPDCQARLEQWRLVGVNRCPYPRESSVVDVFRQQVSAHPDEIAVTDSRTGTALTYAELDVQSDRLCRWLSRRRPSLAAETLVGVYASRCPQTIVMFLGILKANLGYLPLDVKLPPGRLDSILSASQGSMLVLTGDDATFPAVRRGNVDLVPVSGVLKEETPEIVDTRDSTSASPPTASSIAYVMFTSGSTGRPKGVIIEHRGIVRLATKQGNSFKKLDPRGTMAHVSNLAFDASTWEIYTALLNGATLVCVDDLTAMDADALTSIYTQHRVRNAFFTPALLKEHVQHPTLLRTLHTVCTGGELCDPAVYNAALGLVSGTVIHCYGPTEDTCMSTVYCPEGKEEEAGLLAERVPIGRPISNTGVCVMDSALRPVPVGIVGELVTMGDGLARGYTSSELNADRFVSVNVHGQSVRAYRTGDHARYRPLDGQLEFLGRVDGQVKIRGQRVEAAEIEHVLQRHESVKDAVVVSQHREEGETTLAAFVTTAAAAIETRTMPANLQDELLALLRANLPSYMVPRSITILDKLPINENGKVDRKALAGFVVTPGPVASAAPKRQPSLPAEQRMQRIWAGVLKMEPEHIGVDDNFFWIGGDSISAMKVVAAARKDGLALSVGDIFADPRLCHVAEKAVRLTDRSTEYIEPFALIRGHGDAGETSIASLVEDVSSQCPGDAPILDAFPCSPLQEGLMTLSSKEEGGYMMQAVLRLNPDVSVSAFRGAWEAVVRLYPILRTRIVNHNTLGLLQVVLDEDIRWIDDASELDEYIQADRRTPMGVGEPLVRLALVKDGAGAHAYTWFVLTAHHALYDGWSLPLILDAVNKVYHGTSIDAPAQYQLFIKHTLGQRGAEAQEYWRALMQGCETWSAPFPVLPVSVKQPLADQAVTHQFAKRGDSDGHGHTGVTGVTMATFLRAAWALVAGHMTSSSDVVFGATLAGRNVPIADIDQMPAPTIATVPVRVRFTSSQTVGDYLQSVQRGASQMMPFEQTGLHRIAKISSGTRQACLFQTLVVIHPESSGQSRPDTLGTWHHGDQDRWFNTHGLTLDMFIEEGQISVKASFDSAVLEAWLVSALLDRLGHVVHQLQRATPETTLGDVEMASPADLDQLWAWNSVVPRPAKTCIHDMVGKMVEARPHAHAVCAWDGDFTYTELDKLATVLARRLSDLLHVGPGAIVPLCFEKSRWAVVGMLAVLKAGAAFVLLEPSQPISRLRSIIDQTRSRLVVSSSSHAALCGSLTDIIVSIGTGFFQNTLSANGDAPRLCPAVSPQPSSSPMYLVFTSGSTGVPKGVVVTHEAFCSALRHQAELFGYSATTRALDFSSYMFDVCLLNTFATLAVGGCVCVPSESDRKENLTESLLSMKVNLVDLTPSVARALLHRAKLGRLQTVVLGGEVVRMDDVTGWPDGVRVVTTYGPAECTPSATISRGRSKPGDTNVSIGFGAGAVTWVTDAANHDRLAPLGAVGELLLEGPILGEGYLNDPDRTGAAFIKDPDWLVRGWAGHAGRSGRLYKTGDLVRYNQDGSLVYVGRKDAQVKIRGRRVELGDVEHHISQCLPGVGRVVVEAVSPTAEAEPEVDATSSGPPILVAFVCMESSDPGPSGVRASVDGVGREPCTIHKTDIGNAARLRLAEQLPPYMIPAAFLRLASFPSTASGKVNRRQLRDMARSFFGGEEAATPQPEAPAPESPDTTTTSRGEEDSRGEKGGHDEEIAHKLAQKILSMTPSWTPRNGHHPPSDETSDETQLGHVLLHTTGLDSVNMMSLIAFIRYEFDVRISMHVLVDRSTTIRSLALRISEAQKDVPNEPVDQSRPVDHHSGPPPASTTANTTGGNKTTTVDLLAEIAKHDAVISASQARSKPHINGNGISSSSRPANVFLTGANGFLGIELLRQLLEDDQIARVTALVRAKTAPVARARLISAAKTASWWTDLHEHKLQVWPGDLSLPRLGLDAQRWKCLQDGSAADVIIHNGAEVHFTKPYPVLESTNVLSTVQLLDMAVQSQHMRLVYVGGGLQTSDKKTEEEVMRDLVATDSTGYSQTKFVAEALVRRAAARNAPEITAAAAAAAANRLSVMCPGIVIGSPTEGFTNPDDYIWRLVASCLRIGVYNDAEVDTWLPVSDVSATAARIITAAMDASMTPLVQLHHGMKFGHFWAILKDMGYKLRPIRRAEWLDTVREDIHACKETHPLWPLAHALESNITWLEDDASDVETQRRETPFKLKLAVWKSVEFLRRKGSLPAVS
ncbi:NRPS protein [Claviceps pusilla]|uniref:D-lysergyl-peptide-synthetase subunit 1 n=1 Tax=Claviceps pusilla TaxID=123648 RepID=A0A9P7T0C1_9HYPO|nr:NRPS protein [Claviceps pusilla]